VVGLVAVTPAAGFISPMYAVLLGAIAAIPSYFIIVWRARTKLDDSLDVMAAHGIGGTVGALLTGVFAAEAWGGTNGLLFGNAAQLGIQAVGVVATIVYSAVATFILLKVIGAISPIRVDNKIEGVGLDVMLHSEEAYSNGEGAILLSDVELNGK
jgi:Amt family ammonium transporter